MTMYRFAKLMVAALIGSLGGVLLFAQMPPIGCVQPAACSDSNCPGDAAKRPTTGIPVTTAAA